MRPIRMLLVIPALVVLLSACAGDQNVQMNRWQTIDANKAYPVDKISFADDMKVVFTDIKTIREGQFLKIQFELMNTDSGAVTNPVYLVEWLDKDGFVKSTSGWKPVRITGNQKVRITEMANLPSAVDYKITIGTK